jgi:hypothetical protein
MEEMTDPGKTGRAGGRGSGLPGLSTIPLGLAAIQFLLHILTNGNYGMFRDEFYYIACARRLAWGYVDQPPLSLAVLAGYMRFFGDTLESIRILPALAGSASIVLTGLIARDLGGRRLAQGLAALCVTLAPVYLVLTGFFSMNAFDLLFWTLAFYLLVTVIRTGNARLFVALGFVLGLGLLNKVGVLVLCGALGLGFLVTPGRRYLRSRYLWLGAAVAALIFLPYILWQISNGWPTLEFIANAKQFKIADLNPLEYFLGQVTVMHPVMSAVWLAGLVALLAWRRLGPYRILGIIYIVALVVFMLQKSKVYYLSPVYPPLIAAGAVWIERLLSRGWLRLLGPVVFVLVAAAGVLTLPLALPILEPSKVAGYEEKIGLRPPPEEVHDSLAPIPQYFADRMGWDNMVGTVASVYRSLDAEERAECTILADNYGEAGAIDYLGPRYGLPKAVSGHNNYYLWGPGPRSGEIVIAVGVNRERLEAAYEHVTQAAVVVSPYAMPWETDLPVYVCRGLKVPREEAWRMMKMFI